MEAGVKAEVVNGTPVAQRAPKNSPQANKNLKQAKPNESVDNGPAEKKARFNQGGGNQTPGNQNKGFGGGGPNKGGFGNRNRGNRNLNRPNHNQSNFQNQQINAQNKPAEIKSAVDVGQQGVKKDDVVPQPNQQGQQQPRPQQQQPRQQPQQQQPRQPQQQQQQRQPQQQQRPQQQQQQQQLNQNQQQQQNQNQHQQNRGGNRGSIGGGGGGGVGGGGLGGIGSRDRRSIQRGGGGGGGGGGPQGGRSDEFFVAQRLRSISGPTLELPPIEAAEEAKFSGRNRLYVGNLTNDVTEYELREIFKPFGEIGEVFCNPDKNFTFLKLDYHANAEKAKRELDGTNRKGRVLRVRFAPNATMIKVKNLTPFVSNELLKHTFEIFGGVERANITVDDRGKPTGEGVVEFAKKSSANVCLRFCNEKCFFLTASLRPCVVEPYELNEDPDGLPEKSLNKKTPEFNKERSVGPRFADLGSFEHEYGTRWKQLHELYKAKQEALKRELKMEEDKLEAQMEYARYEHETELLRQELRKRESDNERKKREWEIREKQAEDMKKREEENVIRQQSEMQLRIQRQEEEMRRRQQENTLFIQAQQLNSLLDQQEGGFVGNVNNFDNFGNNSPFDFRGNNNNVGGGPGNNANNNPQEPFQFEFGGNNQNQGGGGGGGGGNQRGGNNGGNNNHPWERRRRF